MVSGFSWWHECIVKMPPFLCIEVYWPGPICSFFLVVLIGRVPCVPHTLYHPLMPPNHCSSSFMSYCVLGHVHISFRSDFFTECKLVLPLSISSILSFPEGHPIAAYVFFLIFPSLLSSVNQWTYNVSKPRRCSSVLHCN